MQPFYADPTHLPFSSHSAMQIGSRLCPQCNDRGHTKQEPLSLQPAYEVIYKPKNLSNIGETE